MSSDEELSSLQPLFRDALFEAAQPPDDLWPRIVATQMRRDIRRNRLRYAGFGALTATLAGVLILAGLRPHAGAAHGDEIVDWQARAQALELQLAAVNRGQQVAATTALSSGDGGDLEAELGDIDRLLQRAYERGTYAHDAAAPELTSLWKRRSELLDTMLVARKQGLALTRI